VSIQCLKPVFKEPKPGCEVQSGQGMTEYIIIVALVAVAAIAVYQYLGQVLRAQTAAVAKELAGEDGTQQTRAAKSAAQSAASQAAAKSLKDFTGNATGSGR
jgi:Flp pilus assembly pilin Flp